MQRGNAAAQNAATTATNNSEGFGANAQNIYGSLEPSLTAEATNPTGYGPADLAAMQTEAAQSAGGSQAAAVGQGGLLAARTRNAGGPAAAIANASRNSGEQLSKNLLGITTGNARLKQQQREEGLTGLENLTGLETNAQNQALGQVAPLVNANTNAQNESWDAVKYLLDPTLAAGGQDAAAYIRGPGGGG